MEEELFEVVVPVCEGQPPAGVKRYNVLADLSEAQKEARMNLKNGVVNGIDFLVLFTPVPPPNEDQFTVVSKKELKRYPVGISNDTGLSMKFRDTVHPIAFRNALPNVQPTLCKIFARVESGVPRVEAISDVREGPARFMSDYLKQNAYKTESEAYAATCRKFLEPIAVNRGFGDRDAGWCLRVLTGKSELAGISAPSNIEDTDAEHLSQSILASRELLRRSPVKTPQRRARLQLSPSSTLKSIPETQEIVTKNVFDFFRPRGHGTNKQNALESSEEDKILYDPETMIQEYIGNGTSEEAEEDQHDVGELVTEAEQVDPLPPTRKRRSSGLPKSPKLVKSEDEHEEMVKDEEYFPPTPQRLSSNRVLHVNAERLKTATEGDVENDSVEEFNKNDGEHLLPTPKRLSFTERAKKSISLNKTKGLSVKPSRTGKRNGLGDVKDSEVAKILGDDNEGEEEEKDSENTDEIFEDKTISRLLTAKCSHGCQCTKQSMEKLINTCPNAQSHRHMMLTFKCYQRVMANTRKLKAEVKTNRLLLNLLVKKLDTVTDYVKVFADQAKADGLTDTGKIILNYPWETMGQCESGLDSHEKKAALSKVLASKTLTRDPGHYVKQVFENFFNEDLRGRMFYHHRTASKIPFIRWGRRLYPCPPEFSMRVISHMTTHMGLVEPEARDKVINYLNDRRRDFKNRMKEMCVRKMKIPNESDIYDIVFNDELTGLHCITTECPFNGTDEEKKEFVSAYGAMVVKSYRMLLERFRSDPSIPNASIMMAAEVKKLMGATMKATSPPPLPEASEDSSSCDEE